MVADARPEAGGQRPYHFPSFERGVLPSGSELIVCPVTKLPLATLLIVFGSGSTADQVGLEGTARLTAKLLVEGAGAQTGSELAEALERIGTTLETGADWDSSIARVTFLTEHTSEVISRVAQVILEPTFPGRELERLKAERIAELLQIESEPRALADEAFESFLYTVESRFAVPSGGSKETLAQIEGANISTFYRKAYTPANATFIMVGDVTYDDVHRQLSGAFSDWPRGHSALPARRSTIAAKERRVRLVHKADAPQSELRVGHGGLARNHPDYFPVVVMNAILGGLFGSRINLNLREAHGYTYGASSYFDWRKDAGPFVISTAVATDVTAAALKEILFELRKIGEEQVTNAEHSLAKDYLDGVFPIRYETTASIAAALANLVVYRLPDDYFDSYRRNIQSVSKEQVLAAATKHLKPEALQTLIVGDVVSLREGVLDLGLGAMDVMNEGSDT